MRLTLYQRLAGLLLGLFIAVGGVFYWWSHNLDRLARNEAEQRLHIALAEHLAHDNPLLSTGVYDQSALKNLFHTLMVLGPGFEFYFVDPKGKILTYSAPPGKVKRTQIALAPLVALIDQKQALPIYGDDPRDPNGRKIFSASRIYDGNKLQGYLYVIIGGEIFDSIFSRIRQNQQWSQSAAALASAVVFFFLVWLGLLRFLTQPLKDLSRDIRNFRAAGFEKSRVQLRLWPGAAHNEIHELGQTFNDMAEQINYQLVQLQNNDKERRELLAHLSHDLRTPLASLQGYLETIELKGHTLDPQQHRRFIAVAFKNASQLKHLVDQIFELAHLEGGQVRVNLESFPLAELLYDIVAKFELKAKAKSITLSVEPEQCRHEVFSDIGKLERVLSNLIENAIRHTPKGGKIVLKVGESDGDRLMVEVSDNGSGIADDDLPHVFEARYRAGNAIDDKRQHGGLGLAISQKLLALLKSEIAVESAIGEGTTFRFSLTRACG